MSGGKSLRRAVLGVVVAAATAVALTVGAGSGAAATSITVHLTGLIDSVSGGGGPSNLAAGRIGYHVTVDNDLVSSNVTHVVMTLTTRVVNAASPANATFEAATSAGATCGPKKDARGAIVPSQMECTVDRLATGAGFAADISFTAPTGAVPADPSLPIRVEATAEATVSAQTNGSTGNMGTSTWPAQENPVSATVLAPSTASFKSFLRPGDSLPNTGVLLHAKQLTLPTAFVTSVYGVVTSASEVIGTALCDKCPTRFVDLSIPASSSSSSPFSATNYFTFTLTLDAAGQPNGYKPVGVTHNGVQLQQCSTLPAAGPWPTGMCQNGPLAKDKKTGEISAFVRAYENGFVGFD
jgi:hypothetical protein